MALKAPDVGFFERNVGFFVIPTVLGEQAGSLVFLPAAPFSFADLWSSLIP